MGWLYSLGRLTVLSSGEDIVTLGFGDEICDRSIQKNYRRKMDQIGEKCSQRRIWETDKINEEVIVAKYLKDG